jgi:hypothetical protein
VRTPDAARLVQALHDAKLPALERDGYVVCEGVTPETVAPIMVENRIAVYEMGSSTESLESLFFALTGGEGMQIGQVAPQTGDYRRFNDGPQAPPAAPSHSPGSVGGQR